MRTTRHGTIISLLLSTAILLVELLIPLSWDNWVYHTAAWDLVHFGRWPYTGTWTFNFPGMIYLDAVAIWLFGSSALSFRLFDLVFQVITCYLLLVTTRRYFSERIATLTPVVYSLIYVSFGWSAAGQVDAFVPAFLLAGVLLIYHGFETAKAERLMFVGSGALVAFCAILRPTYFLFPAALLIFVLFHRPRRHSFLWLLLGCAIGIVLPLSPVLFTRLGLYDFYTQAFRYGLDVYGRQPRGPWELWASQKTTLIVLGIYLFVAIITFIAGREHMSHKRTNRFEWWLYLLFLTSNIISILVMQKFLVSHILPLIALLSPIVAFAIVESGRRLRYRIIGEFASAALLGFFAYRLYPKNIVHHFADGMRSPLGALTYCYDQQDHDPQCGYLAERDAAEYLKKIDPESNSVEVFSSYRSYLRVPCSLNSITRFDVIMPLALRTPSGTFTPYQQEWQREFVSELETARPTIIVAADNGFRVMISGSPLEEVEKIQGFKEFFAEEYRLDTTIHGFAFYLRRSNGYDSTGTTASVDDSLRGK